MCTVGKLLKRRWKVGLAGCFVTNLGGVLACDASPWSGRAGLGKLAARGLQFSNTTGERGRAGSFGRCG